MVANPENTSKIFSKIQNKSNERKAFKSEYRLWLIVKKASKKKKRKKERTEEKR